MREIQYRGKRKDNGEWVEGYYAVIIDDYNGKEECGIFPLQNTRINGDGAVDNYCFVVPETVGQYTDFTDSNDNKIFEGDIVKLTDDCNDFKWKAVVVFGNPNSTYCCGWNFVPIDGYKGTTDILMWVEMEASGAYCEVIGNIYDNPELLENNARKDKSI